MIERVKLGFVALGTMLCAFQANAAPKAEPLLDCPLRDVAYSADTPMIDIMLNPKAMAVIDAEIPGATKKLPPHFSGTVAPTFSAIMAFRTVAGFMGLKPENVASIDAQLRKVPISDVDKRARCARYDATLPQFNLPNGNIRVLLFDKVNGFVHTDAMPAARAALQKMASQEGWALAVTDKGGAFNAKTLRKFDVIIWNNNSGDVLTLSQRAAFQKYVERGGGVVAIHGAGGDPAYFWDWYADTLLGARFKGHPMAPQFQDAKVTVEAHTHPVASALPANWTMKDEWYSFHKSPRLSGSHIVLTLDEASYKPGNTMGLDLHMGDDHPIAWTNCVGKGRAFYSAIGHRAESYSQPQNLKVLQNAIGWAANKKQKCAITQR